ncbi:MAG TPA: ATP-binding protein [Flavobacteriales bacterium]|nr:ATP-binding protein [Flavobacteriales bacterium]
MATIKPPSEEHVQARIRTENPWWTGAGVDMLYREMRHRAFFAPFMRLVQAKVRRAVVLLGPRRVGKTVMLQQCVDQLIQAGVPSKKICLLSVDQPVYSRMRLDDLFRLCRAALKDDDPAGYHVLFDEIQYLADWERDLKVLVDTYPRTRFVVSGSAAAALKAKSQESGAGRFTEFLLPPLTFHEFLHLLDRQHLIVRTHRDWGGEARPFFETVDITALNALFVQYITFGGYPEALFDPLIQKDPGRFIRSDIVDKVLLRDLPSLYGIGDVQELNRFFSVVAYNTGQVFSYGSLGKTSGVDAVTIRKYLEYLEAAYLIRRLRRLDLSAKQFKREHGFKVYLTNPSLRTALFGPLPDSDVGFGALAETAVHAQGLTLNEPVYYANWKEGRREGEVDFVRLNAHLKPDRLCEVKWSDRFVDQPAELKSLLAFAKQNNLDRAVVTTRTRLLTRTVQGVELRYVPIAPYVYHRGIRAIEAVDATYR